MSTIKLTGTSSGSSIIKAPDSGSTNQTFTLPAATGTLLTTTGSGANLTGIEGVPSGVIAMWHGASSAIPSGWVICDGNNSTPNLTDKFIKSTGTANATGGGTTSGATTLATSQIPSHTHGYEAGVSNFQSNASWGKDYYGSAHTTGATGGGGSHTHTQAEPVYFSLIFIMKT